MYIILFIPSSTEDIAQYSSINQHLINIKSSIINLFSSKPSNPGTPDMPGIRNLPSLNNTPSSVTPTLNSINLPKVDAEVQTLSDFINAPVLKNVSDACEAATNRFKFFRFR
jgi:hypothetical protein